MRGRSGKRVDVSEFDDLLEYWYTEEGHTVREVYHLLQSKLDDDEWTTEIAVSYRLQELGLKDPHGYYADLELQLLDMDADEIPARSEERSP